MQCKIQPSNGRSAIAPHCCPRAKWRIIVRSFFAKLQEHYCHMTLRLPAATFPPHPDGSALVAAERSVTGAGAPRTFGSTRRRVAPIGQGSWKIEESSAASAVARHAPRPRSRLDPHRYRRNVRFRFRGEHHRRGDRRPARRGVSRLQGSAGQCLETGHARGVREIAGAPAHRPAGLLPAALARRPSPAGNDRGLRHAGARRQDPLLGREQFRRRGPRRGRRHRRRRASGLQSGAVPPAGARDRTCRAALVPAARHRAGRVHALRPIDGSIRCAKPPGWRARAR